MDIHRMRDESYRKNAGPKGSKSEGKGGGKGQDRKSEDTSKPKSGAGTQGPDPSAAVRGLLKTGSPAPAKTGEGAAGAGGHGRGTGSSATNGRSGASGPPGAPGAPAGKDLTGQPGGSGSEAGATGAEKAAHFLMVVGRDEAAEVLRHLDDEQVEAVTREIARIGTLSRSEAQKVLEEVGAAGGEELQDRHGGPAVAREFLNRAFGEERAEEVYDRLGIGESDRFAFLEELEPQQVVLLLKEESPPVIATILSTLNAAPAARVVGLLPEELRAEVVLRMARMNAVSPQVLERVEEVLKERIRQQGKLVSNQIDGRGVLASILRHMDLAGERAVLESLAEEDPDLARSIRDRLFTIDSILAVDDRDLQQMLTEFDEHEIACVLIGQSERVRTKLLRNVSERRAKDISEQYVHQADIPDKEVASVQQRFLDYLRRLAEEGAILARYPEDEYI
jgi:flagellar motor switch protein FliG